MSDKSETTPLYCEWCHKEIGFIKEAKLSLLPTPRLYHKKCWAEIMNRMRRHICRIYKRLEGKKEDMP